MANPTLERPAIPTETPAPDEHADATCPICSEFGSEECDVLENLGRYRATEASVLSAIAAIEGRDEAIEAPAGQRPGARPSRPRQIASTACLVALDGPAPDLLAIATVPTYLEKDKPGRTHAGPTDKEGA